MTRKEQHDNLREACIQEAMTIIETSGIENLSMREVSRRLGVSHQAPYKHFESRDHILAEILMRSFEAFAHYLDSRQHSKNPQADLKEMGFAYLRYAAENPLQYRLMFSTPLPAPAQHPKMMEKAQYAFSILRDAISKMTLESNPDLNALFVWSTMHGLASILHMQMFTELSVADHTLEEMIQHIMMRVDIGLINDGTL
ncbi:MAG: TetR/AcrR family transcriptional regulator [Anaerolineae bacterium]